MQSADKELAKRCESALSDISLKSFNYNSFIDEIEECPD